MSNHPNSSKTILLVEDELPFRHIYKDALMTLRHYNVIEAEDGEEALEIVKANRPNLILLDLVLPKKSGFEVLSQIKNDPELKSIPIIVYSILDSKAEIDKAMKLGANDYTIKGVTPSTEVVSKVEALL